MELSVADLNRLKKVGSRKIEEIGARTFTGVSTDSRTTKSGEIFFALKGEKFDGHAFLTDAFARGAAVAVVEATSESPANRDVPLIIVKNTTSSLGELARLHRMKFSVPVIAIGGSNGKTTTKEMIAQVLRTSYRVLSTEGNFNNNIGVPLTLLKFGSEHEVAVVEIGTNHSGEIGSLCRILDPTHGLVTTIGREHLEFFGSIDGVAAEEGVLYEYLRGRKGSTAFVNSDDKHVVVQGRGVGKTWRYGFSSRRAKVQGKLISVDERGCTRFRFGLSQQQRSSVVQLQIPGEHHASNALAAATVGLAFDVPLRRIRSALMEFKPASKRMEVLECAGILIYNDTYNANPDSMIAALKTLGQTSTPGKRIAVLAEMRELGEHAAVEHARVGQQVEKFGIDYLLTFGAQARAIHEAAEVRYKFHYDQKNVLAEYLTELVSPGDVVLVKGSRGMKMEDVVTFVQERLCSEKTILRKTGTD